MNWFSGKDDARETKRDAQDLSEPFVTKYGTWCRTCLVREDEALPVEYLEAFQQDDGTHRWSLKKVSREEKGDEEIVSARTFRKNIHFLQAMAEMAAFEHSRDTLPGEITGANAEELGAKHYRAFAEREGVVFDTNDMPHLREHPEVTPDGQFRVADLDRGAKAVKAAQSQPVVNGEEDLLSDIFNDLAPRGNYDAVLDALVQAGKMKEFGDAISDFSNKLSAIGRQPAYVKKRRVNPGLPKRRFVPEKRDVAYKWSDGDVDYRYGNADYAFDALERAHDAMKTLSQKGLDTSQAERFLHKCMATAYLVHAQGYFVALKNSYGSSSNESYAAQARALEKKAAAYCKKHLGIKKAEDFDRLKQSVIQGSVMSTPPFIRDFIQAHSSWSHEVSRRISDDDYKVGGAARKFLGGKAF